MEVGLDASLGTAPSTSAATTAHHEHGHLGGTDAHQIPAAAAASIVADFHHGNGNLDLSSLGQPASDHYRGHGGGDHHASAMPMPAAIALMHEEAHRAAQLAHH